MGVRINAIYEVDISCKDITYEMVTNYGATAGVKRKRAEAIGESEGNASNDDAKKENDET